MRARGQHLLRGPEGRRPTRQIRAPAAAPRPAAAWWPLALRPPRRARPALISPGRRAACSARAAAERRDRPSRRPPWPGRPRMLSARRPSRTPPSPCRPISGASRARSCPCPTRPASCPSPGAGRRAASSSSRRAAPRAALAARASPVEDVADLTGFPEMMDGRVKTLHPAVHGGLLAVRDESRAPGRHGGARDRADRPPGRQPLPVRGDGRGRAAPTTTCVENIDIGGPAMIRAAAKNHADVAVVVDVADYERVLAELGRA